MEAVQVWRAEDVAALYGVDQSTVYRWERAGQLRRARRDPGGGKYWLGHELLADLAAEPDEDGSSPAGAPTAEVAELVAATRRQRQRRAG